jgi:hypothetical protein
MVVTAEELCPECGSFVPILHEVSGFCNSCSEDLGYKSIDPKVYASARMRAIAQLPRGQRKYKSDRCIRGHKYIEGSYSMRKDGARRCHECDRYHSRQKRDDQIQRLKDPDSNLHGTGTGQRLGCRCAKCDPLRIQYNLKRRGRPQ